jgi:hypothetical protein
MAPQFQPAIVDPEYLNRVRYLGPPKADILPVQPPPPQEMGPPPGGYSDWRNVQPPPLQEMGPPPANNNMRNTMSRPPIYLGPPQDGGTIQATVTRPATSVIPGGGIGGQEAPKPDSEPASEPPPAVNVNVNPKPGPKDQIDPVEDGETEAAQSAAQPANGWASLPKQQTAQKQSVARQYKPDEESPFGKPNIYY